MTIETLLLTSAALFWIGVYGALSQQSFVMIMMGIELMLNAAMLAAVAFWRLAAAAEPKGQMLAIVAMTIMAVEAASGFALVIAVFRTRKADITEKLKRLRG